MGQLELVLSAAELCVSLSSQAGDDSQPSGHSQVRSAWPAGLMVPGDGNAVRSSSFSSKQPCPLPAGVTSSARHAFPSLFPLTSAAFSSAAGGCQPGMEQLVEPSRRWEHGKSHRQARGGRLGQARCSWQGRGLSRAHVVTRAGSSWAGHLQPAIPWSWSSSLAPGAAALPQAEDATGQEQLPRQPGLGSRWLPGSNAATTNALHSSQGLL